MKRGQQIDFGVYGRGFIELVKHPSILLLPFIAALIDVTVSIGSTAMTDPLGGFGQSIFSFFTQLIFLFSFGAAIIQASNIMRGFRGGFDASWEECRRKAGGIMFAAVAFIFLMFVARYLASGLAFLGAFTMVLQLAVAFFLIYVIPAAAIGGLPGGMAVSASIRAVRAKPLAAAILAVVFVVLQFSLGYLDHLPAIVALGPIWFDIVQAVLTAIVYGYLAFPFAKTYDDVAFRGFF